MNATRAKDLVVPRVYLELRTPSTAAHVEKLGHCARDCRSIAVVGEGDTGEDDWTWNAQPWDEQQPESGTGSAVGGLWLCSLGGQGNSSNPQVSTVRFGVHSGADITVISLVTASDYPREHASEQVMQDCTEPVEDTGDKYSVLKGPLGNTFAKTTVAPV